MLIRKVLKLNILVCVMSLLIISVITFNPLISSAEIPVDSYCQLTIQSMQQEISNYQGRIALVSQYVDDPDALAQQEEIFRAASDQARNALYSSYGTTAEEYVLYMGNHGRVVDDYLAANPDIKSRIDSLTAQIMSLMDQFETLKGSAQASAPLAP